MNLVTLVLIISCFYFGFGTPAQDLKHIVQILKHREEIHKFVKQDPKKVAADVESFVQNTLKPGAVLLGEAVRESNLFKSIFSSPVCEEQPFPPADLESIFKYIHHCFQHNCKDQLDKTIDVHFDLLKDHLPSFLARYFSKLTQPFNSDAHIMAVSVAEMILYHTNDLVLNAKFEGKTATEWTLLNMNLEAFKWILKRGGSFEKLPIRPIVRNELIGQQFNQVFDKRKLAIKYKNCEFIQL